MLLFSAAQAFSRTANACLTKKRHFRDRAGEFSVNLKTNSPKDGIHEFK
jgi:hypothetical protein